MSKMQVTLGKWTIKDLDGSLRESCRMQDSGKRIGFLSYKLLGTGYKDSTLTGSGDSAEVFVIDLEGVDCFTFIDYVEAMRLSCSFGEFVENLKTVRYREGNVSFAERNHFFTDWIENRAGFIEDVTDKVGAQKALTVRKMLNKREDDTSLIPGIKSCERQLTFIPTDALEDSVISRMSTGDYAGIYSEKQGLDVSHVGIVIKEGQIVKFRHASSAAEKRKVIDEDILQYIKDKPGIIILRPRNADK